MKDDVLVVAVAVLITAAALPPIASADTLNLSLAVPTETAKPGSTLSFLATVSAPATNTANVFLNSDSTTVDYPLLLDDSDFFNFPLTLAPGHSFTGDLFTIDVPAFASSQPYNGYFEIDGGSNGAASDFLGSVTFQVIVTPEPGSIALFPLGLLALWIVFTSTRISTAVK